MILGRLAAKEMRRHPGRAVLTLLSIVLGVGAVLSVSLAINNAQTAYEDMYKTLAGRAALEVAAEDGSTLDASLAGRLQQIPGVKAAVPEIQRFAVLFHGGTRFRLMVLGVDPLRNAEVREFDITEGGYFEDDAGALLESGFARAIGVHAGDEVRVLAGRSALPRRITILGLLAPRGPAGFSQGGALFLPLGLAQRWFGLGQSVDTISLVLEDGVDERQVTAAVSRQLPTGLSVRTPAARTRLARGTLLGAEQGLNFASALIVVLAVFIILNTFLMNLSERRRQLAILRAIGATRWQVVRMIVGEALVTGVAGTVLGCAIGPLGAQFILGAIAQVLGAAPPALKFSLGPFVLASLVGPVVAVIAAIVPTWIAVKISPLEGIRPVVTLDRGGVPRWVMAGGLAAFILSGLTLSACIAGWLPVWLSIPFGALYMASFVPVFPAILPPAARWLAAALSPIFGVEGRLGSVQLLRRIARTTLTVGVLYIAIATGVGLGTTILNSVQDVRDWYRRTMVGDFFLRAMFQDSSGQAVPMPREIGDEIRGIGGVTNVDTVRFLGAQVGDLPVVIVVREFTEPEGLPIDLSQGDPQQVRRGLFEGEAVIGTVLAQRTGLRVGDRIILQTTAGPISFRIAGTAVEYMVGGLVIYLERSTASKSLPVDGADAFLIRAAPERLGQVQADLQRLADEHGLMLHSFADLSRLLDGIMTGVVWSLWAVLALGCLVAALGVANTLTMNVLEQTREIALLRVVAMTRRQVRKMVLAQAVILGILGLLAGIIAGLVTAWFVKQAMVPLLGYPIDFVLHPGLLAGSVGITLVIVLAAASLPAERAARLNLLIALQYE